MYISYISTENRMSFFLFLLFSKFNILSRIK